MDLRRDDYAVDALELKALSAPSSLLFLLGVECDISLCITRVGVKRKLMLKFPMLCAQARRLLELCSSRMGLSCCHDVDHSVVSGIGVLPVLRYVDFLPGQLHIDEILGSFGIARPKTQLVVWENAPVPRSSKDPSHAFLASFIDYLPYTSDAVFHELHSGSGFCLALERGLSLASHSHLVAITFKGAKVTDTMIESFQRFAGWGTFDLRFDDETTRRNGVIVMPTVQDAMDLFEKYEDEDSDDDDVDEALPFSLRPVAPLVAVPFVEDAQLRKFRQSHWDEIVEHWATHATKTKYCVVVSNLYEKVQLADVVRIFEGLSIVESSLVEDHSPFRRRRAFVTFADAATTKEALGLDGKNTHGKALRIQVSPPYVDANRRGPVVRSRSPSPSPQSTPVIPTSAGGRMPSPIPDLHLPDAVSPSPNQRPACDIAVSPIIAPSSKVPPASHVDPKTSSTTTTPATTPATGPVDGKKTTSGMNVSAKEFVPKFLTSPAPPPYSAAAAAPPPYQPSPLLTPPVYAPPPPYQQTTPQQGAARPNASPAQLPAYALPPPYTKSPMLSSALPPPYIPQSAATGASPPTSTAPAK